MTVSRYDWKQIRHTAGWSQAQLMQRLDEAARATGVRLPNREVLKRAMSRWENGHCEPSPFYLELLRRVYRLGVPTAAHLRRRNSDVFSRVLGDRSMAPIPVSAVPVVRAVAA